MAKELVQLKDEEENLVYPQTVLNGVVDAGSMASRDVEELPNADENTLLSAESVGVSVGGQLVDLQSVVDDAEKNNFGNDVILSSSMYLCPCDGYITMISGDETTSVVLVRIYGATTNKNISAMLRTAVTNAPYSTAIFVKKGMRVVAEVIRGGASASFVPLV